MKDIALIKSLPQAFELFKPLRIKILQELDQPRSCTEVGDRLGLTPQKVYYHVKVLQKAKLVRRVRRRQVRGIMEGIYQASARSYWLAPELVGQIGGRDQARDTMSIAYLVHLAEQLQVDIGRVSSAGPDQPTVGLDATIYLKDAAAREDFLKELSESVQKLAEKYGKRSPGHADYGEPFKLMMACYRDPLKIKSHED